MPKIGFGSGAFRLELDPATKKIKTVAMHKKDRFRKDFNVIEKIGEGSFGMAHKVTSKLEGGILRAVKKQKERYHGMRDRDIRMQEVAKAFQICPVHEQQ